MYQRKDGLFEKQIRINGKKTTFHGRTEREVLKKIAAYKGEVAKGRTFKEVAEAWKAEHFKEIEYNTSDCYVAPLADVIAKFGTERINLVSPTEIQAFLIDYAKKGRAKQTVKLRLTVIRQIFDFAILNGEMSNNPAATLKVPKQAKAGSRDIPDDKYIEMVKKAVNEPFGLFAMLLLYTGCRRNEALALTYNDIDRKSKTISISKSVVWENSEPALKSPKSESGNRIVPLIDALADAIPKKKAGYIFGDEKPLTQKQFRCKWDKYCIFAGLAEKQKNGRYSNLLTPHQLRHSYATILFDAGIDSKDAKDILGHSKESVTRDIYTHIKQKRKENTIEKLNNYLKNFRA